MGISGGMGPLGAVWKFCGTHPGNKEQWFDGNVYLIWLLDHTAEHKNRKYCTLERMDASNDIPA